MPSICYVVQESAGKNLLPARDHGEIRILLTVDDLRKGLTHCTNALKDKLSDFDCNEDFLILVGDPILMGLAMVFAAEVCDGSFTVLRWDREHYKYEPTYIRI